MSLVKMVACVLMDWILSCVCVHLVTLGTAVKYSLIHVPHFHVIIMVHVQLLIAIHILVHVWKDSQVQIVKLRFSLALQTHVAITQHVRTWDNHTYVCVLLDTLTWIVI